MHSSIAVAFADISSSATTAALAQTADPAQKAAVQGQLAAIIATAAPSDVIYKSFILNGVDVADAARTTHASKWQGRASAQRAQTYGAKRSFNFF